MIEAEAQNEKLEKKQKKEQKNILLLDKKKPLSSSGRTSLFHSDNVSSILARGRGCI